MEDFNSYVENNKGKKVDPSQELNGNLVNMITSLASKYNGASENELLMAIYKEAEKGRRNGTLSDRDLDNFAKMLAPLLDDKKRAKLKKVIEQLKRS